MKTASSLPSLLTLLVFMLLCPTSIAQIDLEDAKKHGFITAVTTTMRLQSEKGSMVVTGKHELLRESLLLFIRDQGLAGLKVSFPRVQWPDGSQSDPNHCGYTGEFLNGYHRFIQNNRLSVRCA